MTTTATIVKSERPCRSHTIGEDRRSEPLAITQLMLLYHLFDAVR